MKLNIKYNTYQYGNEYKKSNDTKIENLLYTLWYEEEHHSEINKHLTTLCNVNYYTWEETLRELIQELGVSYIEDYLSDISIYDMETEFIVYRDDVSNNIISIMEKDIVVREIKYMLKEETYYLYRELNTPNYVWNIRHQDNFCDEYYSLEGINYDCDKELYIYEYGKSEDNNLLYDDIFQLWTDNYFEIIILSDEDIEM